MLHIITNYTLRSHVLCGEALKDVYADFRLKVLREVEWATWHSKMKVPGGKGWCIRKVDLPELLFELNKVAIPYYITEYVAPPKLKAASRPPTTSEQQMIRDQREEKASKPKKKGIVSAYNLFTKEMWADRAALIRELGEDGVKKLYVASSHIGRKWRETVDKSTWLAQAQALKSHQPAISAIPSSTSIPLDSYEYRWVMWKQEQPHRGYEYEYFEHVSDDVRVSSWKGYRFLVYDGAGEPLVISIPLSADAHRDEIFKYAWENQ